MGMFARLLSRRDDTSDPAKTAELAQRYQHIRGLSRRLNNEMLAIIPEDGVNVAGKRLGVLRRGILVFDSEEEMAVLMDYVLHEVRENGCNTIEKYLLQSQSDPETDEMLVLRAMQHAVYSLFEVESVTPGLGVRVRDLLSGDSALVADLGMSASAKVGFILAARLLALPEFCIFSGASIPVGIKIDDTPLDELADEAREMLMPDRDGIRDSSRLIRMLLEMGCMRKIRYADFDDDDSDDEWMPASRRRSAKPPLPVRSGPNGPCSCGSGRKRKNCCKSRD